MAAKKQNKGKVGQAKPAARGASKGSAKAKPTASSKKSAAKPAKKAAKPAKAKVSAKPAKKPVAKAPKKPAPKSKPPAKKPLKKAAAPKAQAKKAPGPTKADLAKQKAEAAKQKAALQKQKEREKALAAKEREKALAAKEREKALALKAKEQEKLRKQKEQAQLLKQKEREKAQKEREKALAAKEQEKAVALKAKEKAAAAERARKEKEAERERLRLEKEAERERLRLEKEAERERARLEKERVREEARLKKEEERRQKDAEREAYRKAREAEREKLRAEKEAARRALEGKVARQNRQAQRIAGVGRGGTSRVYRPDTVPNQSHTTRRSEGGGAGPTTPRPAAAPPSRTTTPLRPTPPRRVLPDRVEARHALIQQRLGRMPERFRQDYSESFDMSWIHHDSALEGVVYTYQELKTAIDPNITVVPDSSLQPVCEEIRRHKAAIDWVRDQGEKKRAPITVDTIKKLYVLLHPEEGDVKTVKYRREIPQHRLYFHEYAPPDKIGHRVRQVVEWFNGPEPKKLKDPVRVAARVHYDLLRVFPFQHDSGKVARLLMNLILIRSDLPPVIIHSTERQRYYDALKGTLPVIVSMVNDSMRNALASIEKVLDEEELKVPGLEPLATGTEVYAAPVRPARRSFSRSNAAALEDDDSADGDSDDDSDSDDDD